MEFKTQEEQDEYFKGKPRTQEELDLSQEWVSRLQTIQDMKDRKRPASLVKSLIPCVSFGRINGDSATGKSFVVLDLMLRITRNVPEWMGQKIYKHGNVVYVMTEGSFDYADRVKAWELGHPEYPAVEGQDIYVLAEQEFDAANPDSLEQFVWGDVGRYWRNVVMDGPGIWEQDSAIEPVLIVFDTQRGILPCIKDEKDNSELNNVAQTLKGLAVQLKCVMMLIHHTPLADSGRAAGATSVRANADFEFALEKSGATTKLFMTKNKYGALPVEHKMTLHTVTVPDVVDEEGDSITSCWPELVPSAGKKDESTAGVLMQLIEDTKLARETYAEMSKPLGATTIMDQLFSTHKDGTRFRQLVEAGVFQKAGERYVLVKDE